MSLTILGGSGTAEPRHWQGFEFPSHYSCAQTSRRAGAKDSYCPRGGIQKPREAPASTVLIPSPAALPSADDILEVILTGVFFLVYN